MIFLPIFGFGVIEKNIIFFEFMLVGSAGVFLGLGVMLLKGIWAWLKEK